MQSSESTWRWWISAASHNLGAVPTPVLGRQHNVTIWEMCTHLSLAASTSGMTGSSIMSMCASFLGYLKVSAPGTFSHQISHLIAKSSHRTTPLSS